MTASWATSGGAHGHYVPAPQAPAAAPAPSQPGYGPQAGYQQPNGAQLTPGSFPMSGFRDPNSFAYLMQALGMGGQQGGGQMPGQMQTPTQPQNGLQGFGQMDFGSIFAGLLGQSQGYQPQVNSGMGGLTGGMAGMYSGQQGQQGGGGMPQPWMNTQIQNPAYSQYMQQQQQQPGPQQNPLAGLNQYAGPFGNGGGYFGQRKTIQPVTIKQPAYYGK